MEDYWALTPLSWLMLLQQNDLFLACIHHHFVCTCSVILWCWFAKVRCMPITLLSIIFCGFVRERIVFHFVIWTQNLLKIWGKKICFRQNCCHVNGALVWYWFKAPSQLLTVLKKKTDSQTYLHMYVYFCLTPGRVCECMCVHCFCVCLRLGSPVCLCPPHVCVCTSLYVCV